MSLPLSTKYTLKDVTFNSLVRLWDREFSAEDLALMDANPELVIRFGLGEDKATTGLSITKEVNDLIYTCSEEGNHLLEIDSVSPQELLVNFNTHADNSAFSTGTITNLQNGFTKIDYGTLTNSYFYLRKENSEFLQDLEVGKFYTIVGEYYTDSPLSYPALVDSIGKIGNGDGIQKAQVTFKATSVGTMRIRAYCASDPRVVYWKLITVREVSNVIEIKGAYTRNAKLQYGVQTLELKLNKAGVPTALTTPSTIGFENNNTATVDTQLKPKLDPMTIMQIMEGDLEDLDGDGNSVGTKSQRTEERILVIDSANGNKYYVDKTLQTYIPALPVSTATLKLTNTAMIGYQDTIDTTKTKSQAWSKALTQEEINEL